jgi:hypothetical protein
MASSFRDARLVLPSDPRMLRDLGEIRDITVQDYGA